MTGVQTCALPIFLTAQKPDIIIEDKNKKRPLPADIVAQDADQPGEQPRAPQPQFDFYTIIPSMEVNVSEFEEQKEGTVETPGEGNGIYILQTGSFEQYESADEMKARLALLGVKADIQRVVINGRDIRFRVRVGPYQEQDQLEETRKLLLANNMDFVLLRLNVSGR